MRFRSIALLLALAVAASAAALAFVAGLAGSGTSAGPPRPAPAKNVQKAIAQLQIEYAVAQDNSYGTWNAFKNQYWPAVYLIDKRGAIVYSHYGEGRYGETEKKIQTLLAELLSAEVAP